MTFVHGTFVGKEKADIEYKSSSMHFKGTNLTSEKALCYLKSNKFIFNNVLFNNIQYILRFYVGKYFSAFMNSTIPMSTGKLFLGINDMGYVTGIPFQGKFPIHIIETILQKSIHQILRTSSPLPYMDFVDISLHEVKYNKNIVNEQNHYNNYQREFKRYNTHISQFSHAYNHTTQEMIFYTRKLEEMLKCKIVQKELYEYIYNKLGSKNIVLYKKLVNDIKNERYPHNLKKGEIKNYKYNIRSVYYWITMFKDERIQFLKSIRPIKKYTRSPFDPNCIISQVEPLIPNWMNHNSNMNLYVIELKFNVEDYKRKHGQRVFYIQDKYTLIDFSRKLDVHGNPYCDPF